MPIAGALARMFLVNARLIGGRPRIWKLMSMGVGDEPAVPCALLQLTWNGLSRIVSCLLFFACRFSVFGLRGSSVLLGGDVEGGGSKDNGERWEETESGGGMGFENEQSLERREMVLIVVFGNLPTLPNNLTSWSHSVLPASGRILY
jgi:hypothetical protein